MEYTDTETPGPQGGAALDWHARMEAGESGEELLAELLHESDGYDLREELVAAFVADDLAAERVSRALKEAGARDFRGIITALKRRAVELRRDRATAIFTGEACPVPPDMPSGYFADSSGVYKEQPQGPALVCCRAPTWIEGRHRDVDDGGEYWTLAWIEHNSRGESIKRTVHCSRGQAQTARRVVELADRGYPVSSESAGALVGYLEAYAARNQMTIPGRWSVRHMGWTRFGFTWGSEGDVEVDRSDPQGLGQIARACRPRRDAAAAAELDRLRIEYGALMAAYAASLTSPVLHILGRAGFVLSLDGRTSSGKTTALRLAASAWGDPSETDGLVFTWDNTAYFVQRTAANLGHMPLCIDDTRRWKGHPGALADCVYDLTQGRERGRMSSGLRAQEQRSWRLATISTGEGPLSQSSGTGGLRARVLQVWGSPFGGSMEDDVRSCNRASAAHYGVDGPRWVAWLHTHGAGEVAARAAAWLASHPVEGDVGGRLAEHAALVCAVASVASEVLGWALPGDDAAELVWSTLAPGITESDTDADPAERAWGELEAWLVSLHQMQDRGQPVGRATLGEWQLVPSALRRWLEDSGYRQAEVMQGWAESGRLIRREAGRNTSKVHWGESKVRLVCVRRGDA